MSTASRNCRFHGQRLQGLENHASKSSGSFNLDPWALRPERLQWLNRLVTPKRNKSEVEAKIAAPSDRGSKPIFFQTFNRPARSHIQAFPSNFIFEGVLDVS